MENDYFCKNMQNMQKYAKTGELKINKQNMHSDHGRQPAP